jgi:peroxiredoxin
MASPRPAPEWVVADWLNTNAPIPLGALAGRAVYALAFQMLCPGCVSHAIPQATRVRAAFREEDLAVIGLHTVFEHFEAQGSRAALEAFAHEYRVAFPLAIDAPSPGGGVPQTMRAYQMQGTPTTLLIDRTGRLRLAKFGHIDDLALGAAIATLIAEG